MNSLLILNLLIRYRDYHLNHRKLKTRSTRSLEETMAENKESAFSKVSADKQDQVKYTAKDFASSQDVRWCPGCGDYSILAQMQRSAPDFEIKLENIVWVSGIACA